MAYYTALVTAWNNASLATGATLPVGTAGTLLTGMTTANKLVAINNWTITGVVPTSFFVTGTQLLNCMNWAEFNALTAQQQSNLLALCNNPGQLLGGSANTAFMAPGMILAYFTNHSGPTVLALTALAQGTVTPWWQMPVAQNGGGLFSSVSSNDLIAAGNLT